MFKSKLIVFCFMMFSMLFSVIAFAETSETAEKAGKTIETAQQVDVTVDLGKNIEKSPRHGDNAFRKIFDGLAKALGIEVTTLSCGFAWLFFILSVLLAAFLNKGSMRWEKYAFGAFIVILIGFCFFAVFVLFAAIYQM